MTVEWIWSRGLNGNGKDIIIGQLYTLLQDFNVYLSKKTNKVDIYHNNTRKTICLKQFYLFFTFAYNNILKFLNLLISSDFLFRSLLLVKLINLKNLISFFVRHNWQIIDLGFTLTFDATEYLMENRCYYI